MRFGMFVPQGWRHDLVGIEPAEHWEAMSGLARYADAADSGWELLLDSEVVAFQIRARDDFGVKRVGIEWEGLDKSLPEPAFDELYREVPEVWGGYVFGGEVGTRLVKNRHGDSSGVRGAAMLVPS